MYTNAIWQKKNSDSRDFNITNNIFLSNDFIECQIIGWKDKEKQSQKCVQFLKIPKTGKKRDFTIKNIYRQV